MTLSLYFHIPFCLKKCPYCDFISFELKNFSENKYLKPVLKDIELKASLLNDNSKVVSTIFFGGGTPSILSEDFFKKVIEKAACCFCLSKNPEITMECNPKTVSYESLLHYKKCGINRLSIGVQSFSDIFLKKIGRVHTAEDAEKTVFDAFDAGFENINIDIMFSLPGQSADDFLSDLDKAVSLGPKHISFYGMTLVPDSKMGEWVGSGKVRLPDEDVQVRMYLGGIKLLKEKGFIQYEISNFSKKGFKSQHNLNYWNYGEYLGIGCAAHSFVKGDSLNKQQKGMTGLRFLNAEDLKSYKRQVDGRQAYSGSEIITKEKALHEKFLTGMRKLEGMKYSDFSPFQKDDIVKKIPDSIRKGLVNSSEKRLKFTKKGLLLSDEVFMEFVRNS